ncbi:MAG: hypothetical protein ACI8ZM_005495, partial [Crocinitomix sp.]
MKKITSLLLLLLPLAVSAQSITWDNPIVVNDNNTIGNTRPKIVLAEQNIPLVMWGKATNQGVYTSRLSGSTFTAPVKVTPNGMTAFVQSWAGPDMGAKGDTA